MYAEVAVFVPIKGLFTYLIPPKLEDKLFEGSLVYVPFGNRKKVVGTVVNLKQQTDISPKKIKSIQNVIYPFPVFSDDLLKLTQWISGYYFCSWGEALKSASPAIIRKSDVPKIKYKKFIQLNIPRDDAETFLQHLPDNYHKQNLLLKKLFAHSGRVNYSKIRRWGIAKSSVDSLVNKGILKVELVEAIRSPYHNIKIEKIPEFTLSSEQENAVNVINKSLGKKLFEVFLLYGVTGSGKTQVYIETIKKTLAMGKTAIVLVPEISLTPQTVRRFQSHFPDDIAVFHSSLSVGERFDAWRKTLDGEYKIIVGARSAIFAPIKNLGLIVVDEEHESSYKQTDSSPKYHARDVAIMRAKFCNANVILGSATPSLESMYNAETGKYRLLKLPNRVEKRPLPYVSIVDIKEEYKEKNFSIFSRTLQDKIYERLIREEQIILFLNKRGFSSFVQCKKCGHTIKCQNCDITLTYHRHNFQLLCHYCDYQMSAPDTCPECGSENLNYKGTGTQKVEDELEQLFPKAKILRMDFDTTSRKGAHDSILQKFGSGKADILLGTQMVAKGLDFPNVTLVGVISADISLNIPDFRSSERTFQLLSQVAGRAGRGELGGEVVVQTMIPKHYSILFAQTHDYNEFYQFELDHRKQLAYPPFTRLVRILLKSEEVKMVNSASDKLVEILTAESKPIKDHYIQILGPAPAPLSKIRNFYRWQILIKALNYKVLHQLIRDSINQLEQAISLSKVKIEIDIDAQNIM